jgi:hypothetical protein
MMTAEEARQASQAAREKDQLQLQAQRDEAAKKREEHSKLLLETLPERLVQTRERIKAATDRGLRAVILTDEETALVRIYAVKQQLEKDGYAVSQPVHQQAEENWGDSAAPCIMTRAWLQMEVSW